MRRTGSLLTLLVVGFVVAYWAFVRTSVEAPRPAESAPVVVAVLPPAEVEPAPPVAVVVSLPRRAEKLPVREIVAQPQQAEPLPDDGVMLAREIQRELHRVGCYDREINGIWTTSSRMATQMFTDRVNARLPFDKPDAALLSLLQSQAGTVCGKSCPSGQALDGGGRCLPSALIGTSAAKAPGAPPAAAEKASTLVTASLSPPHAAPQRHAGESEPVAAERSAGVAERPAGVAERPAPQQHATPKPVKFWRSLVRTVDRALGLY